MAREDIYRIKLVKASSPLTTRPSTEFRMAGLVLMQKEACKARTVVSPIKYSTSKGSETSVVKLSTLMCELSLGYDFQEVKVGNWIEIPIEHGDNKDRVESVSAESNNTRVSIQTTHSTLRVRANLDGIFDVTVSVKYVGSCEECTTSVTLSATVDDGEIEGVDVNEA